MPNVTVTVAGTEGPKPGKKRGRVKDTQGLLYQISPALLQMVNIGSTYDIAYIDDEYNGTKFRVIDSLAPAIGGQIAPSAVPYRQPPTLQPQTHTEDERGTDIATLAIAKVWLEKVPVGDEVGCLHALRVARRAWRKFKANPDNIESGRQPMRDEEFPE